MFGNNGGSNNPSSNHLMQMQRLAMQANRNQRTNNFNYSQNNQNSNDPSTNNCGNNDMDNFNNMWNSRPTHSSHNNPMENGNNFGMYGVVVVDKIRCSAGNGPQMRAPYIFKCPECSLLKNSCDDLEIHIKTEHLNWLPFNCPLCTACRASDSQMREHIHSSHKKNDNKYYYLDNPMAKRMLQEMMDRALFSASSHAASQAARQRNHFPNTNNNQFPNNSSTNQFPSSNNNNNFNNGFSNNTATSPTSSAEMLDRYLQSTKRNRLPGQINPSLGRRNSNDFRREDKGGASSHSPNNNRDEDEMMPMNSVNGNALGVTVLTKKSSTAEDLLAKLQDNVNTKEIDDSQESSVTEGPNNMLDESMFADTNEIVDDETNNQLSQIFGNNIKSEFDLSSMDNLSSTTTSLLRQTMNPNDGLDDGINNMDALQNVSAMFSVNQRESGGDYGQNDSDISKKRVLGQCNKCMKPVTAGARQMHMFFHLGKDHDTYRFRCKHPGCTVEHYRKDQMENHQAKTHKKVDLDMMEDRSLELHSLCQKMSMELLGTIGNTPGPTAEKAQILYDKMQEDAEMSALRKRRRGANGGVMNPSRSHSYFGNNRNFLNNSASQYHRSSFQQSPPVKRPLDPRQRINEENLECLLCHKYIMNRIRGFHILWHLNNDLGIIRYNCKFCDYKHDRPQSVTTHGKKEHNDENCLEDSLSRFEDEVKSMSKACFGVEQLFAKEVRRKRMEERNERALQAEQELLGISLNMGNTTDSGLEELHDMETNSNDTNFNDMVQLGGSASKTKNSSYVLSPKEKARSSGGAASSSQSSVQKTTTARKSTRRFGMRRPKSRKQKIEMAKLREISMRLGGAQYFKRKALTQYLARSASSIEVRTFLMSSVQFGPSKSCSNPTAADIERLKANLNLSDKALACATFENDNEEEEKGSDNGEDDEEPDDNESSNSKSNEAKSSKIEDEDDDAIDDEEEQLQIQEGDVEENEEEQEEDDEEETMDADEEEPEESAVNGEEDE
uniref:C2H2-type domain-containing protein n=1 Tax=Ditylenchus dipsaci TaxID=166011 RepID=A0A915D2C1_9BILA